MTSRAILRRMVWALAFATVEGTENFINCAASHLKAACATERDRPDAQTTIVRCNVPGCVECAKARPS
jgi:hypothetical protein